MYAAVGGPVRWTSWTWPIIFKLNAVHIYTKQTQLKCTMVQNHHRVGSFQLITYPSWAFMHRTFHRIKCLVYNWKSTFHGHVCHIYPSGCVLFLAPLQLWHMQQVLKKVWQRRALALIHVVQAAVVAKMLLLSYIAHEPKRTKKPAF